MPIVQFGESTLTGIGRDILKDSKLVIIDTAVGNCRAGIKAVIADYLVNKHQLPLLL